MKALSLVLGITLSGCTTTRPPSGEIRFHNRPPAVVVNDRLDVAKKPSERHYYRNLVKYDRHFQRRLTRWMEMRPARRASNVNSIDEVPDSTWFTNRIGVRDLSVAEIRRGPNVTGTPQKHLPLTIRSSKQSGVAIGFIVEDARGVKYLLKFDERDFPETETSTDAVAQRLLWAAGYQVPEDYVISLRRGDLVIARDAMIVSPTGDHDRMTRSFVDLQLARIAIDKDGSFRALASRYLEGAPLGGHPPDGVRDDDPNDVVPHQLRRELRGAYTIFAWLDHTDVKQDNWLDVYVADPANRKIHYVMHYLVDFGKSFGMHGLIAHSKANGQAYAFDLRNSTLSLLSLGTWQRPWEGKRWPRHVRGIGIFESEKYDPGSWKPNTPEYMPFLDADRFDKFWGAKIVIRFTQDQLRAAVEQGRYSDPRAADYILRILFERQRKTARYWFARVAPLDRFTVLPSNGGQRLCFEDLALRYRLADSPSVRTLYVARAFDAAGQPLASRVVATGTPDGRVCLPLLAPRAPGPDQYTIIRIETSRPGQNLPGVLVHIARDPRSAALRVIGLRRL